jgi:DNA polymerase-3 subunit delta'
VYSWHTQDYLNLAANIQKRNFGALLLHGAANSGRSELTNELIQFALCQSPQTLHACGQCSSCILWREGNHPDIVLLAADNSEERKTLQIKVEQVREVIDFASKSRHLSACKIIHLPDAEQLNISSANALLKVLEEPAPDCIFILQANNINKLLATIKSRCFKYQLNYPAWDDALKLVIENNPDNAEFWLRYFNGEPLFTPPFENHELIQLKATLLKPGVDAIFALSKDLDPKRVGMASLLDFMLKWLSDLFLVKHGNNADYFVSDTSAMQGLAAKINNDKLFALQEDLVFLSRWSEHPLNHKLQFENILFKYQQIYV